MRCMALGALVLVLTGCDREGANAPKGGSPPEETAEALPPVGALPQGVQADAAEEGRTLYGSLCVTCHGERGEGTPLGPALADSAWLTGRTGGYDEILALVRDGVAQPDSFPVPMHPRGDGRLTDEQVRAVAAYTWSMSHPKQ